MGDKVQILLSVMNIENKEQYQRLLEENHITGSIVTVNQVEDKEKIFDLQEGNQKLYSYQEKGVSKSRNKLLEKMTAPIGLLADDDVEYVEDYEKIIEAEYTKNPKADVIIFLVENKNKKRETIKRIGDKKINFFEVMKVRTPEITFKKETLEKIKQSNIHLDDNFGPGGLFSKGEETIFVSDLLKSGFKIYSSNQKIADVRDKRSTWFTGFNKKFLYDQGAIFYRIEPKLHRLLCIQYIIRKYRLYKKNVSILEAYQQLIAGAKACKKIQNGKE